MRGRPASSQFDEVLPRFAVQEPRSDHRSGRIRLRPLGKRAGAGFSQSRGITNNRSPAETLAGIKNKPEYQQLETTRFIKRYGITRFTQNPFFPVNTLVLMRGAVAAKKLAIFERYIDEIFRRMWADPKKLDDPTVLGAALAESQLDADQILSLVQTPEVKDELLANTQRSVERGTFGSPTFFVGDEIFFGKDRLREVEEAIVAGAGTHR